MLGGDGQVDVHPEVGFECGVENWLVGDVSKEIAFFAIGIGLDLLHRKQHLLKDLKLSILDRRVFFLHLLPASFLEELYELQSEPPLALSARPILVLSFLF